MKVSVIGTGSIGGRHLKNCVQLREELGITSMHAFETNSERIKQLSAEYDSVTFHDNVDAALDGTDAAFVCTPTSHHIELLNEIVKHHPCHLYLEKPFSHTLDGCDEIVFAQKRAEKVLFMGYLLPFHPVLQKTKELLNDEVIGKPLYAHAESGFYLPNWHPDEDYRNFYMAWKTGGGGVLLDTSHEINYLQWLFGDITEVKGIVQTVSDLDITSDDLTLSVFHFKNGMYAVMNLDLLQYEESRFCKVVGSKGVLKFDLTTNEIKVFTHDSKSWNTEKLEVNFDEIYHSQIRRFFGACKGEKTDFIDGIEGTKTMQVIEAIRRSQGYSTSVRLPLFD